MGMFSFLKNAGAKLWPSKKKEVKTEEISEDQKKINALIGEVNRLGLPVSGIQVELGQSVTVHGNVDTNADREKVILALGNVEGIAAVDDQMIVANPEPEAIFVTVGSGDSLSKIAKAQYGDPMKYQAIFEANQPMLSHPDKIYPGQTLRIPPLA